MALIKKSTFGPAARELITALQSLDTRTYFGSLKDEEAFTLALVALHRFIAEMP